MTACSLALVFTFSFLKAYTFPATLHATEVSDYRNDFLVHKMIFSVCFVAEVVWLF